MSDLRFGSPEHLKRLREMTAVSEIENARADCAGCGASWAPADEDGNKLYPLYRQGRETGAGYCGWCARGEGFRI